MQQWVYGVSFPIGNEELFLERYRRHNREVLEYFRDRQDDLLVLPIEAPDLWERLGEVLDADVPGGSFPHANKGGQLWKAIRYLRNLIRRIGRRLTGKAQ